MFQRPTLAALIRAKEDDYDSRLPGADARMPASNLNVMARVNAGGEHGLYGFGEHIARQIPFDTAEAEYLERWAGIWDIARKPAAAAVGAATFTGNDGVPIPEGTELQRADGVAYLTTAAVEIVAGTANVPVVAVAAGLAGNIAEGVKLKMVSTVAEVDTIALVAGGGLTGGTDIEGDASLLERFLARIRRPPHGGAVQDYLAWALEVPGVTRAWVYPGWIGRGTVGVAFVCDNQDDIIPSPALVAEVQAYIDARRPVTAEVEVFAPAAVPLYLTISGLNPSTDDVKAKVVANLAELLRQEAEPGATILVSHIREAISAALGETDHVLVAPVANVAHAANEIAVAGVITWS